jgi:hypothetical protein
MNNSKGFMRLSKQAAIHVPGVRDLVEALSGALKVRGSELRGSQGGVSFELAISQLVG